MHLRGTFDMFYMLRGAVGALAKGVGWGGVS